MIIEGNGYRITTVNGNSSLYDLELITEIKSKSGEIKHEFKPNAYGATMTSVVRRISKSRLTDISLDLVSYLDKLLEEEKKLINELEEKISAIV